METENAADDLFGVIRFIRVHMTCDIDGIY